MFRFNQGAMPAPKPFEKSGGDVEPKGAKEGSPKEEAYDNKQAQTMGKMMAKPPAMGGKGPMKARGFAPRKAY
jgi:hypothetical protein